MRLAPGGVSMLLGGLLAAGCADEPAATTAPPAARLERLATLSTTRSNGQSGFNADVFLHEGFAYVGTWGSASHCPGASIKVVDLRTASAPRQVATLAERPGTTSEDVVVRRVDNLRFRGNLLVTGLQRCSDGGTAGVDVWDLSDPLAPRPLATFELNDEVHGVHELDLTVSGGTVLAHLAVPGGELSSYQAGYLVLDLSDPRDPELIGGFGLPRDAGQALRPGEFVHSVRVDPATGHVALSYWDAGVVLLDAADPRRPRLLGATLFPPGAEGNAHSVAFLNNGATLLECDEDFNPAARNGIEPGSGFLRTWDIASPAAPRLLGEFRTPGSRSASPPPGFFSIHNIEVVGSTGFASWYADGIRVLDLSSPAAPREIAALVPPAAADPFGEFPTAPAVWGVATDGDVVAASDMNAGLHVLRFLPR